MAKKSSLNLKYYYCCDFGSFHDYSQCPYSHVGNNTPLKNVDVRRILCLYSLTGNCKYKNSCYFAHLEDLETEDGSKLNETISPELNSSEVPVEESLTAEELSSAIAPVTGQCNSDIGTSGECIPLEARDTEVSMVETTDLAERVFPNAAAAENRAFILADHANDGSLFPLSKLPDTKSVAMAEQSSTYSDYCKTDYRSQFSDPLVHAERCLPPVPVIESVNLSEKSSVDESARQDKMSNESSAKKPIHLELHQVPKVPPEDLVCESELSSIEDSSTGQGETSLARHISDEFVTLTPPIPSVLNDELDPVPEQSFANVAISGHSERDASHTSNQNLEESGDDNKCGICLENMTERIPNPTPFIYRYGILPNCKHIFCLDCIRRWRCQATRSQHPEDNWSDSEDDDQPPVVIAPGVARSCPVCRISSYFVVPSAYYVKDQAEKDELIAHYKGNLRETNCKYFKRGGLCKFRKRCFYLHAVCYCKVLSSKFEWTLQ